MKWWNVLQISTVSLFLGYQKENERLYEEIKQLKSVDAAGAGGMVDKTATAAMFKENQKLLKEIGHLRLVVVNLTSLSHFRKSICKFQAFFKKGCFNLYWIRYLCSEWKKL